MENTNVQQILELLNKLPNSALQEIDSLFFGDHAIRRLKDLNELYSILYSSATSNDQLATTAVVIIDYLAHIFYCMAELKFNEKTS